MTKTIFTGTCGCYRTYTSLRIEKQRRRPTEILILAALALAISVTGAAAALKLLFFLVSLPLKLLGSLSATGGAAFELVATLGVLFLIAAAIAFVLVLVPVAAIGALAIALVS